MVILHLGILYKLSVFRFDLTQHIHHYALKPYVAIWLICWPIGRKEHCWYVSNRNTPILKSIHDTTEEYSMCFDAWGTGFELRDVLVLRLAVSASFGLNQSTFLSLQKHEVGK